MHFLFPPHKEFRFLLPILPLANIYVGVGLWRLAKWFRVRKYRIAFLYAALHIPLALYFSMVHMRGALSIMTVLQNKIAEDSITAAASPNSIISVHFLMPCYATPLTTHLHVNMLKKKQLKLRVLDCTPRVESPKSEKLRFIANPTSFVQDLYHGALLPDYIVLFDIHAMKLRPWLESMDYVETTRVFHSHYNGDYDTGDIIRQLVLFRQRIKGRTTNGVKH